MKESKATQSCSDPVSKRKEGEEGNPRRSAQNSSGRATESGGSKGMEASEGKLLRTERGGRKPL